MTTILWRQRAIQKVVQRFIHILVSITYLSCIKSLSLNVSYKYFSSFRKGASIGALTALMAAVYSWYFNE